MDERQQLDCQAYKTEATRTGSAALATRIRNHVQAAVMEVDWTRVRLIRSAFRELILAMMCHLPKWNAQEIGEYLSNPNDVLSDFWPSKILRGLMHSVPLPTMSSL